MGSRFSAAQNISFLPYRHALPQFRHERLRQRMAWCLMLTNTLNVFQHDNFPILYSCSQMFIEKYRNLTFLEQQLEEYSRAEQDRFEVSVHLTNPNLNMS